MVLLFGLPRLCPKRPAAYHVQQESGLRVHPILVAPKYSSSLCKRDRRCVPALELKHIGGGEELGGWRTPGNVLEHGLPVVQPKALASRSKRHTRKAPGKEDGKTGVTSLGK